MFVTVTGWLLASPSDEINKALTSSGNADAKKASATAFLDAFTSALVQADESQTSAYVTAAQQLRPDLKDQIAAAATQANTASDDASSDSDHHVSGHRKKVKICCRGHTLVLPPKVARHYLETHPQCTRGPCCDS